MLTPDRRRRPRSAGPVATRLALVLSVVAAVAACAGDVTLTAPSSAPLTASDQPASAPSDQPLFPGDCAATQSWPNLAADQQPTAALRCETVREHVAGHGEWEFFVTQRSATGQSALVAALRLPDEAVPADQSCRADLPFPVQITLEIAGRRATVAAPQDSCRKTRQEVRTAWAAMTWSEISRVRGAQTRVESAVASGCEVVKDMLGQADLPGASLGGGPRPAVDPSASVRVCRYSAPIGDDSTDAVPVDGLTLVPAVSAKLADVLARAIPAPPCDLPHNRLAVLFTGGDLTYVELDGCHRVLTGYSTWWSVDAAGLLAAIG